MIAAIVNQAVEASPAGAAGDEPSAGQAVGRPRSRGAGPRPRADRRAAGRCGPGRSRAGRAPRSARPACRAAASGSSTASSATFSISKSPRCGSSSGCGRERHLGAGRAGRVAAPRSPACGRFRGWLSARTAASCGCAARPWTSPLANALRLIPGGRQFTVLEDGQLIAAGKLVPRGRLPEGPWRLLGRLADAATAATNPDSDKRGHKVLQDVRVGRMQLRRDFEFNLSHGPLGTMRLDVFLPFLRKPKKGAAPAAEPLLLRMRSGVLPRRCLPIGRPASPGCCGGTLKWLGPTWLSSPVRRVVQGLCLLLFLWLFFYVCYPYDARPRQVWTGWRPTSIGSGPDD